MWSSRILFTVLLYVVHLVLGKPHIPAPEILKPLPIWDNDASWHSKRSVDYSTLDLRDFETFIWGNPGDEPHFTFANMTMYTKDGEMIISMERFAPMLKSVVCGDKMVLTFKDQASFQYAIKAWDWVNDDETHSFIMVADYAGCGPDEQRQPYYVYNADYDKDHYTAYLYATEKTWPEVAHTFDLDYGRATVGGHKRRSTDLSPRWGPTFTYDKDLTMNLAHDWSQNLLDLETPSGVQLKVDCTDCGTKGQLTFSGHIQVDLTSIKEFSISASPKDFSAALGLTVSAAGSSNVAFTWQKTIGEVALVGFDIPGVASLGAVLSYDAGVTLTNWTGKATISYGVSASLSNSAIFKIDLTDPDNKFEFSGWAPTFSHQPLSVQAQVSADVLIYSQPEIGLQLSVLGNGYEAAIQLKVPEIEIQATETHNVKGVCGTNDKDGVELEGKIGVELALHIGKIGSTVGWQKPLWDEYEPFFDQCLAIADGAASGPSPAPVSGPSQAPPAGGSGANAQTTTTASGTAIYIPKPSTTLSIPALSATPTLIYNCAYMPLICANVAAYSSAHLSSASLPSKQLFFFDGDEARKNQRRKEACGCFDHSKCTAAAVTNLASQIAGPHTFSPTYASLLSKGPVPTSSASGPIDPRFWSDGIALTCDEFPAASWVQGGAGANTICATQQWSIFATWNPNPQSGKWMLPPGTGKRSEQDWQGLSHARLRSILVAQAAGLGSNAVAPFWFTTTSVASTPSKAWIEVAGVPKAVITKRSGDVDMPEATLSPEWAGPGRKIKEGVFIPVGDAAPVPDWDNKAKRAPNAEPELWTAASPGEWEGQNRNRKDRRMFPAGDGGSGPPPATTTKISPPEAKATPTPSPDSEGARGQAICGDGSEDPDYGDEGFV